MGISALVSSAFYLLREPLLLIFNADPTVLAFGSIRMKYIALLEFLTGSYEISAAAMRGMGYSIIPAVISVLGTVVLRIAWLNTVFVHIHTLEALLLVYPVSWVFTGIVMLTAYFIVRKKAFSQ